MSKGAEQVRQKLGCVAVAVGAGAGLAAHSTKLPHERNVLAAQEALQTGEHPVVDGRTFCETSLQVFS